MTTILIADDDRALRRALATSLGNLRHEAAEAGDGDEDRVGAWPEKFIFDTQLGPNRNGRHW